MSMSALSLFESGSASGKANANPAIAQCCHAWKIRYKTEMSNGEEDVCAARFADASYRAAMPPLVDYESIRDFIACTAHGMLIETIQHQDGTRLLYAAQVALSTLRRQPRETRRPGRPKCLPNK
jgi:hypothetical protein